MLKDGTKEQLIDLNKDLSVDSQQNETLEKYRVTWWSTGFVELIREIRILHQCTK